MAQNYMKKATEPAATVWIVSPVGRVVEVIATAPEAFYASEGEHKWRLATESEIESAKEAAKAKAVKWTAQSEKEKAANLAAKTLAEAGKEVKRGPGRPRKEAVEE